MQYHVVFPALVALYSVSGVVAQDAATTNPLNAFIGAAQSGVGAVKSITAEQTPMTSASSTSASPTSSSSPPPPPPASSSAAAASSGLSTGAEVGIIVGAIVAVILLLALVICLCCCLFRRRSRDKRIRNGMTDEEAKRFNSKASNPGRDYNHRQSMEQHPSVPLMAAAGAAGPHNGHGREPSLSQHPALRDNHGNHHYGRDAALLGAGGLAAHEMGKRNGHNHNASVNTTAGLPPSTPHSTHHLGRDGGLAGAGGLNAYEAEKRRSGHNHPAATAGALGNGSTQSGHHLGRDAGALGAGGLAAHEVEKHHHGHGHPATTANGLGNDSTHTGHHLGRDAGLIGAGGLAAHEAEKHHHRNNHPSNVAGGIGGGNNVPHTGNHHLGRDAGLAGAGGLAAYEAEKHLHGHQDLGNARVHDSAISSGTGVGGISNGVNHHTNRHERDAGFESTPITGGPNSAAAPTGGHHHLGRDAGLAGAGGLAAYEVGKHHHDRESSSTAGTLGSSTDPHASHHYQDAGLVGAGGLGARDAVNHNRHQAMDAQAPPAYSGGAGSYPTHRNQPGEHHQGHNAALAGAGGIGAYEAESNINNKRHSKIENPFVPQLPGPRRSAPNSRAGPTEAMAAGAVPETQGLRDRSRSRSHSRPRSGDLPKRNDRDRPPTPFGLSGIGQPYEDMHVHRLVSDPPSQDLQQALHDHEAPLAAGALGGASGAAYVDPPHHEHRKSRGFSTPPEVPSRSPNRGKPRDQVATESSYDSSLSSLRDSSSGTEQYQRQPDPYAPAQHASVPPWEAHQSRYSQSPPTSATMAAPPIPWSDPEYVHEQRRHSHSPRQSMDGRRKSRSPATSINGQPRRLRFEDLQSSPDVPPTPTSPQYMPGGYAPVGGHDNYDGYDHARWSQGVGEAM